MLQKQEFQAKERCAQVRDAGKGSWEGEKTGKGREKKGKEEKERSVNVKRNAY